MSIKLEDYGIVPEWAIDKRIVSETKFLLGAKSDSICSHCNNFIAAGEASRIILEAKEKLPLKRLKSPKREELLLSLQSIGIDVVDIYMQNLGMLNILPHLYKVDK